MHLVLAEGDLRGPPGCVPSGRLDGHARQLLGGGLLARKKLEAGLLARGKSIIRAGMHNHPGCPKCSQSALIACRSVWDFAPFERFWMKGLTVMGLSRRKQQIRRDQRLGQHPAMQSFLDHSRHVSRIRLSCRRLAKTYPELGSASDQSTACR